MDNTYRFGTMVLDIPDNPNHGAEVYRDGSMVRQDYRETIKRGYLDDRPITDAEAMWLLGFDDEVAAQETAWRAVVEQ